MTAPALVCIAPRHMLHWLRIRLLYRLSFPRSERKPFAIIRRMHRQGKTDLWCFYAGQQFVGFAATINNDSIILLDYLATEPHLRGRGYGAGMLKALQEHYDGKGMFVEIESPYTPGDDQLLRKRRKEFYFRCGFLPMNVMANVFDVPMELMGWHCRLSFQQYKMFYRNQYSAFAADHIHELPHPDAK